MPAASKPLLMLADTGVWFETLQAGDAEYRQYWRWLSEQERQIAQRFVRESHRRRYVICHGKARLLLSRYPGIDPGERFALADRLWASRFCSMLTAILMLCSSIFRIPATGCCWRSGLASRERISRRGTCATIRKVWPRKFWLRRNWRIGGTCRLTSVCRPLPFLNTQGKLGESILVQASVSALN